MRVVTEQPEWMVPLPGDSYLNGRDMVELFDIGNKRLGLAECIKDGSIPPPTQPRAREPGPRKYGRTRFVHERPHCDFSSRQWSIADLRKFFKQQKG